MPIVPLHKVRAHRKPVVNANDVHAEELTTLDKLAVIVTQRVGTPGFFLTILGWSVLWLLWNIIAPADLRFDPAPAFVLWLFISNAIQILLMPLIMIGQNIQGRHAEIRADLDFEINQKAEREIEQILERLEEIRHFVPR